MKITLALLAVLLLAFAIGEVAGWPLLRQPLQRQLSQRLQRNIELGQPFSLHFWGAVRVKAGTFKIGPAPQASGQPDLIDAKQVRLTVPYATVWCLARTGSDSPLRITSLEVADLKAWLHRDAQGVANWNLGPPRIAAAPAKPFQIPHFGRLVLKAGDVTFNDEALALKVQATVSTTEGDDNKKGAGLRVEGKGQYVQGPFEVKIASSGVLPLVAEGRQAITVPVSIEATAGRSRFDFDGKAMDVLSFHGLDGRFTLSGPSMAAVGDAVGVTLPTTSRFTLKGLLSKSGEVWTLKQANLDVGSSQLGGDFTFDRRPKVPLLTGELRGSNFVLTDLAPAFGAPAAGADNPAPPKGKVLPQKEFDIPSLHAMDARVKLRLQKVQLGTLFVQPLQPLSADLSLQSGVLSVKNVLARAADGQVRGSIGLDANHKQAAWSADLDWADVRLEKWIRPRDRFARDGRPPVAETAASSPGYVSGRLGGRAVLRGSGNSTARMLGSLDGTARAWINDGRLSHLLIEALGLDVAQALGVMVSGDTNLPMRCAVVSMKAHEGVFRPDVAIVDTDDTTVFVSGSLSLATEQLALKLTAKPKDTSPLALRAPLLVEGSFSDPHVRPEMKPLARKLIASGLLALVNPLAAIIPLIDIGDPNAGGCQKALQKMRGDGPAAAGQAR